MPAVYADWEATVGDDKTLRNDQLSNDLAKCEAIAALPKSSAEVVQYLASILQKTDDAAEFSLLTAIDELRRSLAACHKCQGAAGDLLQTFTNDIDTKIESRFHYTTCKVMEDATVLQSLSDSSTDVKAKVGYDEAVRCAEQQTKALKQKYCNV